MTKRIPIIFGLILLAVALWLILTPIKSINHLLDRLESLSYDIQLRTHVLTAKPLPSDNPVVIIDIDDKSIRAAGRWPWPRSTMAKLVDKLKEQGVAVIAFDVFFPEPQVNIADEVMATLNKHNQLNDQIKQVLSNNLSLFADDNIFQKSLIATHPVLSYTFLPRAETHNQLPKPLLTLPSDEAARLDITTAQGYISNTEEIQQAGAASGFINIFPDEDGIVRRAPLLMEYKNGVYPSLALQAVLTYLSDTSIQLVTSGYLAEQRLEGVRVGTYTIPTDAKGFVYIPFVGRSYSFPYYSAVDLLEDRIPAETLLGKIVFIGTSATGLGDLQPASVQNPFPGVEIQASIAHGILLKEFSYRPAWTVGAEALATFILGLIAAFTFPYLGPRILALIIVSVPIVIIYINGVIWQRTGLILSFLPPVIMVLISAIFNILYGYLFETRRREQLKAMFGQYVPEKHINEMLLSKDQFSLHGESKDMTVMFADIRSFTTISEGMSASDIVNMLNTYFTPMTEIIHKHMGTVDKYIGDLIMAFWGAPMNDKHHAFHAIQTALHMQTKLKELRETQITKQWPEIIMGIGINSGKMNVGDMGSQFRRNYTVLGDSVNLASRVESLTKYYNVNILVTENTQQHQEAFVFRKVDRVQVKGRVEGIDLYEVICHISQNTPELQAELSTYHRGMELYRDQQFKEALEIFTQLESIYPDTHLYTLYRERSEAYIANPPDPSTWTYTHIHSSK